jgi:hypothetical protein
MGLRGISSWAVRKYYCIISLKGNHENSSQIIGFLNFEKGGENN